MPSDSCLEEEDGSIRVELNGDRSQDENRQCHYEKRARQEDIHCALQHGSPPSRNVRVDGSIGSEFSILNWYTSVSQEDICPMNARNGLAISKANLTRSIKCCDWSSLGRLSTADRPGF